MSFGVFLDFFFGFGFELVYKVFEVVEYVVYVCWVVVFGCGDEWVCEFGGFV